MEHRITKEDWSQITIDGETVCIIRDLYERNAPLCNVCGLRRICCQPLTEEQLDLVRDKIDRQLYRAEFWEEMADWDE